MGGVESFFLGLIFIVCGGAGVWIVVNKIQTKRVFRRPSSALVVRHAIPRPSKHNDDIPHPLSWSTLCHLISANNHHGRLQRHPQVQQAYKTHCEKTTAEFASMRDAILHRVFRFSILPKSEDDRRMQAVVPPSSLPLFVLEPNIYPYWVEPPIQHLVLWYFCDADSQTSKKKNPSEHLIQTTLQKHASERLWKDYIFFINPIHLRSVPDLWHAHVFTIS